MTEVAKFHSLAHIFISMIGAVLLLAIWYNIRKRFRRILEEDDSQKRVDKGLLYLSLALFVWVLSGSWAYLGEVLATTGSTGYQVGINLFSILNNLFLLLALFYFYYAPKFIYNNEKNVGKIILAIVAIGLSTMVLAYSFSEQSAFKGIKLQSVPDLLLSGFLSGLLMVSLYRTFVHRGLKIVAIISVIAIALMFISQLPEVFESLDNDFTNNLIKLVAKTSLIAIFLVLATSWVIRLASMPKPNEMSLKFMDWGLIKMSIPSKDVYGQTIDFGSKTTQYKNLLRLAIRRKHAEGNEQCICVGYGGEIKNQSYLTRIIDNINSILHLDQAHQLERRDLFTFIGEGNYRLRIIPENIKIDEALLDEFTKSKENAPYSTICQ